MNEDNCYRYPKLYIAGQKNKNFTALIFARSLAKGIWVAFTVFFILLGMTLFNESAAGWEWDYQSFGLAASGALTIIVNLQVRDSQYCHGQLANACRSPWPRVSVTIVVSQCVF